MMKSVAIIGAGSAGLGMARVLSRRPEQFRPVVFERAGEVGGTWIYSENTGLDKYGLPMHSSLYHNLTTNLPTDIMAFPDFPFKQEAAQFVTHQEVLEYLNDYTNHFNLLPYIKFNHYVEEITPVEGEPSQDMKWNVRVKDLIKGEVIQNTYDSVVVCNGHFTVPNVPQIHGAETFLGKVFHSHEYKHPETYAGLRVACVGAANSGIDISLELCDFCPEVFLCHGDKQSLSNETAFFELPRNLTQIFGVREITEDSFIARDGERHKIDVLVYCTGYNYSFPFLHKDCGISTIDSHVQPLFKHLVNTAYPTMFFVALCTRVKTFPGFHTQSLFVESVLDGSQKLPSQEDMDEDTEKDMARRKRLGQLPHQAHLLCNEQWDYYDLLCEMSGVDPVIPRQMERLYNMVSCHRKSLILSYKSFKYKPGPDGEYHQIQ